MWGRERKRSKFLRLKVIWKVVGFVNDIIFEVREGRVRRE